MKPLTCITRRTLAASTAVLAISAAPAHADFTAQEVFDAMTSVAVQSGAQIEAGSLELQGGDDVVATDVTFGAEGETFTVDRIEFRDVREPSEGNYEIGEVFMPGMQIDLEDGLVVSVGDVSATDLKITSKIDAGMDNGSYGSAKIGPIKAVIDDKTIFSADGVVTTMEPYDKDTTINGTMEMTNIMVDTTTMEDAKARQTMMALGYEKVTGNISAKSQWNPGTGEVALAPMIFSADDAADFSITLNMGGYTEEVALAIRSMQQQMNEDNSQQIGMAMLGMFQQLEVNSAEIVLKDESLTGRILDFIGAQQGMNRESVAAMAKGMLPIGLAQLGNPDFAAQVQAAVSSYLDDPDRLTVSAAPENPVPVAILMGAAMGDPRALITTLNVQVSAE